jgi:hypothetical protein
MMDKLNGLAEKIANQVSTPRRMFLLTLGNAALATAGVLAANLATRSRRGSGPLLADQPPPGGGACWYPVSGSPTCQVMTQAQCSQILGSTWISGGSCLLRPA